MENAVSNHKFKIGQSVNAQACSRAMNVHWDTTTPAERSAHMSTDQISFYDESLKKQIEGSFVSDGKEIHVSSVYGTESFPIAI